MAQDDEKFTITIDGREHDFADLTLGEVEELEDFAGDAFTRIDYSRAAVMARVAWMFLKREDPTVTLDQVLDRPLSSLQQNPADAEDGAVVRPTRSRAAKEKPTA